VASGFAIYATLIIATGVLNLRQIREMMQRKKDERASGGGSGPAAGGYGD